MRAGAFTKNKKAKDPSFSSFVFGEQKTAILLLGKFYRKNEWKFNDFNATNSERTPLNGRVREVTGEMGMTSGKENSIQSSVYCIRQTIDHQNRNSSKIDSKLSVKNELSICMCLAEQTRMNFHFVQKPRQYRQTLILSIKTHFNLFSFLKLVIRNYIRI